MIEIERRLDDAKEAARRDFAEVMTEHGPFLEDALPEALSPPVETGELVTQADRDAAAHLWSLHHGRDALYDAILAGEADTCSHVKSHAALRRAALASIPSLSALQERVERLEAGVRRIEQVASEPATWSALIREIARTTLNEERGS